MKHGALMHTREDDVAVVVEDVSRGTSVGAVTLDGEKVTTVDAAEDIPLGHKIALREMAEGDNVVKYGRSIGRATQPIAAGAHVHTHNLKSKRWA
ncbi:MAG: UxaA family hydrolase [Spirochaetota bacterium]